MSSQTSSRWMWSLVVLLGAVSYGVLSSIVKLAFAAGYNELQVTFAQLLFGAGMLWLIVLMKPGVLRQLSQISWFQLGLVGLIGISMTTVLINAALSYLTASLSVILLFQFTWMTILMEWIVYRKRPKALHIAAVAVVLAGTLLGTGLVGSDGGLGDVHVMGIVFGLLSAFTFSFFLVFAGRVGIGLDPVLKSAVMMTPFLPVALLIVWLRLPEQSLWSGDMVPLLGWALLLGLLGHVIPTVCLNAGIPRIGSTLSSIIGSAELPAAVISSWLILGEHITLMKWIGIALIVAAIIWRNRISDS